MLPVTSSELSTEFAAKCNAPTEPVINSEAPTAFPAILDAFIALSAIFAPVTASLLICAVSILPST